jgi:hypothetical protein
MITVAYEQFDPGDPGAWVLRQAGEVVAKNHRLLSTDEAGAHRWADQLLDEDDEDEDGYAAYKDGLAMGYIHEDGSYREPEPPEDWTP